VSYTKAALARLATEVRHELGLTESAPFDPHLWAKEYGVPFVSLEEVAASTAAVEHFMENSPERWSAALIKNGSGHLVVFNSAHASVRVRSNLAHEVAHLVAEHELNSNWVSDDGCTSGGKAQETEAAELAGALLIPAAVAKLAAIRGRPPFALAADYEVSVEMATWRMRVSGGEIIARRSRMRRGLR
jgi:Zn-dependent peptidase ImmA (M78 family)